MAYRIFDESILSKNIKYVELLSTLFLAAISRRPLNIQEQVVKDERGKRRFHGAFTGGFSAGYFNTVGSKEGGN